MDWKTGFYEDDGRIIWTNPNGNPKDNNGYYSQSRKFYDGYMSRYNEHWQKWYDMDPVKRDA